MRLPYIADEPRFASTTEEAIVKRVKERRGGKLLELDKALLHAPPVADGWNSFLGSIRTGTTLPASLRELAICRIAVLNQAWYEWQQHAPILRESGGISEEAMEYLKTRPRQEAAKDEAHALMDRRHLLVLEYAEAMTIGCVVGDALFEQMKEEFNDREIVEITSTVAAYNCVSRFLVALDVGEMAEKHGLKQ